MPHPVVHFEIMARDNAAAVQQFYADAFDWKIDTNNPANYGLVDTGGGDSPGIGGGIGTPMGGFSYVTFYIEVPDLQKALDHIASLGGAMTMPPMDVPGQPIAIAMFKDPAGNLVGLVANR
jgi:uncharacterized protein